ncbi:MAG TPA: hypothetical protein VFE50_01685 [Cyclobacteriaceae bacterium]|nr:hypothetical protein [Cyclobacteriaceae bacterium]
MYRTILTLLLISCISANAQSTKKNTVLIDVAHGQKFWRDPADMAGMDAGYIDRVKYMTNEIRKSASSSNGDIGYVKGEIKSEDLAKADLLFIHIPSAKYKPEEVAAISKFVAGGGSLFIVMDSDYWSTLDQVNANDIIRPYNIEFGGESADTTVGGTSKTGSVLTTAWKIPYHGARTVKGGAPFAFSANGKDVFGVSATPKGGGKVIVMGDGMVSLYMTEWENVTDYQCSGFMGEAFAWLLK